MELALTVGYVITGLVMACIQFASREKYSGDSYNSDDCPLAIQVAMAFIVWPIFLLWYIPVGVVYGLRKLHKGIKERSMEPLNSWKKEE